MRLGYLYFEITRLCNHRCVQCFNNSRDPLPGELDTDGALSVLRSFAAQGGTRLQITGGESLARRDVFVLLEESRRLGFEHVILSTNGLLLDERRADRLVGLVDEVNLSLDGFRNEHDALRGRACFDQSVRAIELAVERGFATFVCCCMSPPTFARLGEFVDFVAELGPQSLKLAEIGDVGRRETPRHLRMDEFDPREVFDRIERVRLRVEGQLQVWQSLTRSVLRPSLDADGLVCDPTGALYPMIGYLPESWRVGRAHPTFELDEERLEDYERVTDEVLEQGIDLIAAGRPVNWWTLLHAALDAEAAQVVG